MQPGTAAMRDNILRCPVKPFYNVSLLWPQVNLTLSNDASSNLEQYYSKVVVKCIYQLHMPRGHWWTQRGGMHWLRSTCWDCNLSSKHNPLVPLISTQRPDKLTPWLQRLKMHIEENDFPIFHVPQKQPHTADVLYRGLSEKGDCKEEFFLT